MSGPIVLALRLLLAASLYAFLVWAFLCLWRDIRQQAFLLSNRRIPPLRLTMLDGGEDQQPHHFAQPVVTIGRDPACECRVDDDSVSARHARLSFHHNQWWLEDLGSTNGTLLNQHRLTLPTVVMSGDEIACGETRFTITFSDDNPVPPG